MTANKKDIAFEKIANEFEKFSNLVLRQLDLLSEVFQSEEKDILENLLEQLNENEKKIDKYENTLDKQIINAIVLYQPMASDLRKLFAIYRMVNNLERIGDIIVKIARYISKLNDYNLFKETSLVLLNMLHLTSEMVSKSLLSFFNNDPSYALWTIRNDDVIDELNHKLLKKAMKSINPGESSESLILTLVDIKSVISSIERIGDHSTNIAEASIYAIVGDNIRHKDIDEVKEK